MFHATSSEPRDSFAKENSSVKNGRNARKGIIQSNTEVKHVYVTLICLFLSSNFIYDRTCSQSKAFSI